MCSVIRAMLTFVPFGTICAFYCSCTVYFVGDHNFLTLLRFDSCYCSVRGLFTFVELLCFPSASFAGCM